MAHLIWFREDLRVADNTALHYATQNADEGVIALYLVSPEDWEKHDTAACRVDFILRNLECLRSALIQLNIPLIIREVKASKNIPAEILKVVEKYQVKKIYYNQQYEINESRRDKLVEELLKKNNYSIYSYTDQVILAPGSVLTREENYFTVFTPFKRAWIKQFSAEQLSVLPKPKIQKKLTISSSEVPMKIPGFNSSISAEQWLAGERFAHKKLQDFVENKIQYYDKQRDFPAIQGTSTLSPYLAAGVLSPRQCLQAALEKNKQQIDSGSSGVTTWISELIWREFYKHVLYGFHRVSMNRAFKLETENLTWSNNKKYFSAWCEGKTGYPIVDAAMRQLNQTGWMHNRLRMVVAMFLVKDLWIDWRWGEKYFMQHLIDGDLAANNGGWQWAASTGTDAVPYFRIFNPLSQSRKFDPEGKFIRQYCLELAELDDESIHEPLDIQRGSIGYSLPIVDHQIARQNALQSFKKLK